MSEADLGEFELAMRSPLNSRSDQLHLYQPVIPITKDASINDVEVRPGGTEVTTAHSDLPIIQLRRRSAEILERYKSSHSTAYQHAITANKHQPKKGGFGKFKMPEPRFNTKLTEIMVSVRHVKWYRLLGS